MRTPRLRLTIWRMMVAAAMVGGALACIDSIRPAYLYGPITSDAIMLSVAPPFGPDGRKGKYTEAEWAALMKRMSSTEVLDSALADPRIARLPLFQYLADPRAALSSMFQISLGISTAESKTQSAISMVLLHVNSATAVHEIADAVADAIAAKGSAGVTILGRPMSIMMCPVGKVPWYHDWRVYAITMVSLTAILAVLVLPFDLRTVK